MFYFARGGTRGGRDRKSSNPTYISSILLIISIPEFDWETVKNDKYKEYYLGQIGIYHKLIE